MARMTKSEKAKKLRESQEQFDDAIRDPKCPLSSDYLFISLYDAYSKALEGMTAAYKTLQKSGRYITAYNPDGTVAGVKSSPANGDFVKYLQQCNNLNKQLVERLKSEPLTKPGASADSAMAGDDCDL